MACSICGKLEQVMKADRQSKKIYCQTCYNGLKPQNLKDLDKVKPDPFSIY